ncbi:MAG: V-type ATP synthase subunit F [Candidatus Bathyarchaeota archaeon]
MAKVAVVADEDVATYFRIIGVKLSFSVKNKEEASDIVYKLADNKDVAIIIVTENIAEEIKSVIDKISLRVYPTVLTIPGKEGPIPEKVSTILDLVKRTIGVEIKI